MATLLTYCVQPFTRSPRGLRHGPRRDFTDVEAGRQDALRLAVRVDGVIFYSVDINCLDERPQVIETLGDVPSVEW